VFLHPDVDHFMKNYLNLHNVNEGGVYVLHLLLFLYSSLV